MLFKSFFCIVLFIFSTSAFAVTPQTKIIIFGDSLSDAGMNTSATDSGNNTWAKDQGRTGSPLTNIDSNTKTRALWVNYFITKKFPELKIWPIRIARLKQLDIRNTSINYAYASAETGDNYLDDFVRIPFPPYVNQTCSIPGDPTPQLHCVPGILKQIDLYLSEVHHPDDQTIFFIWAGGNDIFNNIAKLASLLQHKQFSELNKHLAETINTSTSQPCAPTLFPPLSHPILNLMNARDRLIAAGVKPSQIYFLDLPDLSKTPAAIKLANGSTTILKVVQAITIGFNTTLKLALMHMPFSKNNLPDSHVISIYNLLDDIIAHPAQYHFTETSKSCVDEHATPYCKNYVFFNDKHPTTQAGKWIAMTVAKNM
ncbi:MAG: SGNH/GDSL hydrolase family protein [Gammaproteobacteria bacterium]|nr:SGNH/GDSL hydrolase family protein [Gammaproteobacteria bacterium]